MTSITRDAASYLNGAWSNEVNALHDGVPGFASASAENDDLTLYGFDFASLPSSCTILGLEVRIDADKDETDGTGTLWLGCELSWNSGTSWTSTAKKTSNLANMAEATFVLGGAADTWGRSWTRAEIQALRLRLRTGKTTILDMPIWQCDYANVTVHYLDTTTLVLTWDEAVAVVDRNIFSRLQLTWRESVVVNDGGTAYQQERVLFGGDVTDEIQSAPASFQSASAQHSAPHGIAVLLGLVGGGGVTRTFFVGESQLVDVGTPVQSGLVGMGDIVIEGVAGIEAAPHEAIFAIRKGIIGAGTTSGTLEQYLRECYTLGQTAAVFLFVKEGSTWLSKLLFTGVVVSFEITHEAIEFRCADLKKSLVEIPTLEIGPGAMQYGVDEGKLPDGSVGTPIPLAWGRFDAMALESWPTASAFNNAAETAGIIPTLLGHKVPLIPLVLGADDYLKPSGTAGWLRTMRHAIFLFGDRSGTPVMQAIGGLVFPLNVGMFKHVPWQAFYCNLFTWDTVTDRGLPFVADRSTDLDSTQRFLSGSGDFLNRVGNVSAAAYPASKAHGFYINRTDPAFATVVPLWPGPLQAVAVAPHRLAINRDWTLFNGRVVGTTSGVTNPTEALNTNPKTYAIIPFGQTLSVEFPPTVPNLGEIYAMRWCMLLSDVNTSTDIRGRLHYARFPQAGYEQEPRQYGDINIDDVTVNQHRLVPPASPAAKFGSVIFIDPRYTGAVGALQNWRGWKLCQPAYDPVTGDSNGPVTEQPWGLTIWALSSSACVVHVWIEILYRPRLGGALVGNIPPNARRVATLTQEWWTFPKIQPGIVPSLGAQTPIIEKPLDRLAVYASCNFTVQDDAVGKYTGLANSAVENPADIAGHILDKYLGDFAIRAVGTAFGSFVTARTVLNAAVDGGTNIWRLSVTVTEKTTVKALLEEIARQGRGFAQRQINSSGAIEWRYFVDSHQPHVDSPARLYRTTGGLFTPADLAPGDSIRVLPTPLDELASSFVLHYGYHEPTRKYAYRMAVSATADNLRSQSTWYRPACLETETRFGIRRTFSIDAPWIWSTKVADETIKWICNLRRTRRVTVEFMTFLPYVDLQPGHVIRFDDSMSSVVAYVGIDGSSAWSSHYFNVVSATVVKSMGAPLMLRVVAQEVYAIPPDPGAP